MKTKVIVFDFDGTISKVDKGFNCWNAVWKSLNALEVDIKYYNMYKSNQITYLEWCDIIEREFVSREVTKEMIDNIGKTIKLMEDAEKFFAILKDREIKSYILSGGIRNMIEASMGELSCYIENIEAVSMRFDDSGKLCKLVQADGHNVERKDEFVSILIDKYNITPEELLFVGNGANDEDVYKAGVRTLCFNPDGANYENKTIWNDTICGNSLLDILPFV